MRAQIFLNLPVVDLEKSFEFYTQFGFSNNIQFSDDSAKCMVFSDEIFVMLMTHDRFKTFSSRTIADVGLVIAGIYSLSLPDVVAVNAMAQRGLDAGGSEPVPMKDYGFMQLRTIQDPSGHTWEVFCMDMSKMEGA
jgi:uncharacterized protein